MKKVKMLQTAVLIAVQELSSRPAPFSIHDVTVLVRNQANNGKLYIEELDFEVGNPDHSEKYFEIYHSEVRELFLDMFKANALNLDEGYGIDHKYRTFTKKKSKTETEDVATNVFCNFESDDDDQFVVLPTTRSGETKLPVIETEVEAEVDTAIGILEQFKEKIINYIEGVDYPTLKSIQSRFRREFKGVTVRDIADYCVILGYAVTMNEFSNAYCDSLVS